jgi:hypothetical protein
MNIDDAIKKCDDIKKLFDYEIEMLIGFFETLSHYPYESNSKTWEEYLSKLRHERYERIKLTCSICHNNASVNTPAVDDHGNIICHNCLDGLRDDTLRYGINQRYDSSGGLDSDSALHHFYNGHTLTFYKNTAGKNIKGKRITLVKPMYDIHAWTNDHAAFPLTDSEKISAIKDPLTILRFMDNCIKHHQFRCTTCHGMFMLDDIGGRPLFAGKVCKSCWEKHLQHLENQRKAGHVCGMCGHPYDDCCC